MKKNKQSFSLIQRGLNRIAFALGVGWETKDGIKVDLKYLCEVLNINLIPTNDKEKLKDSVTGKSELAGLEIITRAGQKKATIYYKTPENVDIDNDTRSNIAHEIAHYLIHQESIPVTGFYFEPTGGEEEYFSLTIEQKIAKTSNWKSLSEEMRQMEAEADTLGSFILIPYRNLLDLYDTPNFNISYISGMFGTSKRFAQERIRYFEYSDDFRANLFDKKKFDTPPEEFFIS